MTDHETRPHPPSAEGIFGRGHARIATVMAPDRAAAVRALAALPADPEAAGGVDAAEVRLDGMWQAVPGDEAADDLLALLDATPVPLVATLRPARQGGRFEGPETVRVGLLAAAARAGFAAVDLEADVMETPGVARTLKEDAHLVVSHHDPRTPTCDEGGRLLTSMQDRGAAIDKLVFAAGSFADTMRALELTRKHALRGGRPGISTLGSGGAPLRALLALAGNRCTYGHAPDLPPAAPGQPALAAIQDLWRHWGLGKADLDALSQRPSPWFAVLGMPVLHSLSPRIHNAALRAAGHPQRMGALEVPASAAALRLVCMVAGRIGLAGASVTSPHKADAVRMGVADEASRAIGAANCLRFGAGEPEATNTDATAMARLLAPHVESGDPAVVVGSGGAARAAAWALAKLGATVRFTSRDPGRAEAMARHLGATWVPWDERQGLRAAVTVQAAALDGSMSPLAATQMHGVAVELVYTDQPTAFEREAARAGCTVIDGRSFLVEQAIDAYRFWHGAAPDRAAIEQAVRGPATAAGVAGRAGGG